MAEHKAENISEDEAALYDRQIRLWGLDAQRRLRASRILLIGVGGLSAEVAKNVVLSGVNSLTFLDHSEVTKEDFSSNFLVSRKDLGKNRAMSSLENTQKLNSMVEVRADKGNVSDKPDDFFLHFDVICATRCNQEQMIRINEICHQNNIMYFAGDVFGWFGFLFADLNEHHYAVEVLKPSNTQDASGEPSAKRKKTEDVETVVVKKTCNFTRLKGALNVDFNNDKYKKSLKRTPKTYFIIKALLEFETANGRRPCLEEHDKDLEQLKEIKNKLLSSINGDSKLIDISDEFGRYTFSELGPACAIVGGVLGQEIIKAVSQKDAPHNNFFLYSGIDGTGMVDCFGV